MKKILTALFSIAVLFAAGQTADEVIQKYSANMGGLEAFNKITSAKMTGNLVYQGNMNFPMVTQIVNNKAARTEVDVMGQQVIQVYNNGTGWKVNPFDGVTEPTEITGTELNDYKSQASLANNLMDYKARGNKVEFKGEEAVEGVKCFVIELTPAGDNAVTRYFISTADYTLIKSVRKRVMQEQEVEVETFYSDFKEINGVKFAMMSDQKINGQPFQSVKFDKIELNVPIDEAIFKM